eukprot:5430533-Amphidinium_carterae.1
MDRELVKHTDSVSNGPQVNNCVIHGMMRSRCAVTVDAPMVNDMRMVNGVPHEVTTKAFLRHMDAPQKGKEG